MDIWIAYCKREAKCHYCQQPIKARDYVVKGKLWRKLKTGLTHWSWRYYWHVKNKDGECCWLLEGIAYLEKNPYSSGLKGGKSLGLTDEDGKMRLAILRRHAKYTQKIRQAMETGNLDRIIRLATSMEKLKEEIYPLGGIPKKWITETSTQEN